ncbi:phage portal protein family protein [Tenuifilum osseticum]|uniref:phage portal protein family protein n=1 Tax=Tenuifilum TaxID=2760873 RepID=UPI0030A279B2
MATRKERKQLVVNSIVIKPNSRGVLDVGQWRMALKQADRGKRAKLYDLYDDIMLDPVLGNAIEKRIMAITNADLVFKGKNEQSVPELDDLIDSPAFEYLLKEVMLSIFYGKSVIELDFSNGFNAYSIPRQHINTVNGVITPNPGDTTGIPYTNDDFLLDVGRNDNLGLLLRAAPLAIYKRGGFGDWSQFVELFGMPRRIGKYSSHDEESRKLLEEALEAAGSASWMVIPKETEVETHEASASHSSSSIYNEFRQACNEELLITILGQTMTTQNGSSRSQSETHKEVEESINKADRRFVQRVLNTQLLPRLAKRGYPVDGGYFYFAEAGESLSLKDQLDMDVRLVNELGIALDDDYFYETYGRPKPKSTKKPVAGVTDQADSTENWWTRLVRFFVGAPETGAIHNRQICRDCGGTHHINLADIGEFDTDALLHRIANGDSPYFDAELFRYTSDALIRALHAGFATQNFADFEYGFEPDALKTAMETNLYHFSAAKTLKEVQVLNQLFRDSSGFDDFRKRAESVTNVFNRTWLRTEFDTAYHVAESSATYYRLLANVELFPFWEYRTIGDDKVREEHARLHGTVFPVFERGSSVWDNIYPPNGWNCRCYVVPRMKHEVSREQIDASRKRLNVFLKSTEWQRNVKQGFGINRAKEGLVFSANQSYINKYYGNESKYLNKIYYLDYGLEPAAGIVATQANVLMPYNGSAVDWANMHRVNTSITLYDFRNRAVTIEDDNFNFHTTRKKSNRTLLLNALEEAIKTPDEVWINDYNARANKFDNYILIKYYKDTVFVAVSQLIAGKLMLKSWFTLNSLDLENIYRRGLLIKK